MNEFKVLPLFTSAYSFRSILTLDKFDDKKASDPYAPDSIIQICKEAGLKKFYLVEDNMVGTLEAVKNSGKSLQVVIGLRLTFCTDIEVKTDDSAKTECKYVIFAHNDSGRIRLNKIFSRANRYGFFHKPRMDFKNLKEFWSSEDLTLAVPFYDSFIYMNSFHNHFCIPDFSYLDPEFLVENNGIFFEDIITERIDAFDSENKYKRVSAKSIYYKNRADFLAWQTYKCIKNESTLRVPNLPNCSSAEFCFESWKEANS